MFAVSPVAVLMPGSLALAKLLGRSAALELLLLVRNVLAAERAVLLLLQLVGGLESLVGRVVAVGALGALQEDVAFLDFHGACLLDLSAFRLGDFAWAVSRAGSGQDLRHDAGADRPAAFADREAQLLVHRDRSQELDLELDVVARHAHLGAAEELG